MEYNESEKAMLEQILRRPKPLSETEIQGALALFGAFLKESREAYAKEKCDELKLQFKTLVNNFELNVKELLG